MSTDPLYLAALRAHPELWLMLDDIAECLPGDEATARLYVEMLTALACGQDAIAITLLDALVELVP